MRFHQTPEQDMSWLESWGRAVVYASKSDESERLDAARDDQRDGKYSVGYGALTDDSGVQQGRLDGTVQARRRAMKATVRERYSYRMVAQLWAKEMLRKKENNHSG